jgi:hypothetical protein
MRKQGGVMNEIAIDPSVLTVVVLVTCLTCIWMVFVFGRRLQSSAYIRDSLIEGAKQQELRVLVRELRDKAIEGPLDPRFPAPDGYGSTRRLWESERYSGEMSDDSWHPANETESERTERLSKEEKRRQQLNEFRKWEFDERVRFEKLRQEAEVAASNRAAKRVPSSIDISLLGGGWSFLLEFSTVIVIIFTLLILGILKTLEGKDIATILAAIAGYVLGKATSGSRQQETPLAKPPNPSPGE